MMTDDLRQLVRQAPFRPFRLHLADGRNIEVPHPDYIFILHHEPVAIVEREGGGTEWVNLPTVTSIEVLPESDAA
ncbi:MAG TPA: hypothetical protein VGL42_03175 [Opitutaceae bacterium]|jgi:hypothetical protein